jgi:hypothetical protein
VGARGDGAATGAVAGLIFDVSADDINTTFVDEVSNALTKGKTAVIAEIDETWTVPVDTKLEALNGMVFRRLTYEVADDQWARESEAIEAEFRNLKEELKQVREEDKAAIKSAITKLQNKAQAVNDQLNNAIHRRLCFNFGADYVRHFVDQICLVHECPLSSH